tara:strand:+ start:115 stop:486 length:372 start_codon:yes stop_codon:yes gene_type:complete
MSSSALNHSVKETDCLGRIASVDRIGEIPGRDSSCLSEQWLNFFNSDPCLGIVRARNRVENAIESPAIFAEPINKPGDYSIVEINAFRRRSGSNPQRPILSSRGNRGATNLSPSSLYRVKQFF